MKNIFEKPLILDGENGNVVLIYGDYIIDDITKEHTSAVVEKIDNNSFLITSYELVININNVFEYELELDHDDYITFGVNSETGKSYETIDFKDTETAKKAEQLIKDQFKNLGFTRKQEQMSPFSAAVPQLIITAVAAIVGGLLTWFAYGFQDWEPNRTQIVKKHVYIMVKVSKAVGYLPFLIITAIALIFCFYMVFKRMVNPPDKITVAK